MFCIRGRELLFVTGSFPSSPAVQCRLFNRKRNIRELTESGRIDPELAKILSKGVAGVSPLEPDERIRFELLMRMWFTHWQGMHRQISVGAIDEELFNAWLPVIAFYARNPRVSEWLGSSRSALTPEFRAFLTQVAQPSGHTQT